MFFFEKKQPENCDYLAKCRFFLRFDSDSLVILTDLNIFQSFDARLLPKVSQPTKFSSTWPENCEAKAGQARWPGRPARYGQAGQVLFHPDIYVMIFYIYTFLHFYFFTFQIFKILFIFILRPHRNLQLQPYSFSLSLPFSNFNNLETALLH